MVSFVGGSSTGLVHVRRQVGGAAGLHHPPRRPGGQRPLAGAPNCASISTNSRAEPAIKPPAARQYECCKGLQRAGP